VWPAPAEEVRITAIGAATSVAGGAAAGGGTGTGAGEGHGGAREVEGAMEVVAPTPPNRRNFRLFYMHVSTHHRIPGKRRRGGRGEEL
jgi:hypothetical protein